MKQTFDPDIFMGKLLKWVVRSDQSFSTVDDENFHNMLEHILLLIHGERLRDGWRSFMMKERMS